MSIDPASLIVALSGALATVAGIRTASRGRLDANRQTDAANQLNQREQAWEESQTTIATQRAENDRERAARVAAETHRDDLLSAIAEHEIWDAERRRDQPDAPPPPRLRVPRSRNNSET